MSIDKSSKKKRTVESKPTTGPYYEVYNQMAEFVNMRYKTLIGAILTTLEAVVDEDRKLRALTTRVKDLQGLAWEKMLMALFSQIEWSDKKKMHPVNMNSDLSRIITEHELNYAGRLQNLVGAVLADERRLAALNKELGNLIGTAGGQIRSRLHGAISTVFKGLAAQYKE